MNKEPIPAKSEIDAWREARVVPFRRCPQDWSFASVKYFYGPWANDGLDAHVQGDALLFAASATMRSEAVALIRYINTKTGAGVTLVLEFCAESEAIIKAFHDPGDGESVECPVPE